MDSNTNAVEDDDVPTDETESIVDDPGNNSHRAQQAGVGNLVGDNAGAKNEGADDEGSEKQHDDEEKAFYVGKKIYSEKNLEEVISSYEKSMFCSLWKKDVRTLVAARKKTPKKAASAKPSLKYYTVLLKCLFGDEARNSSKTRKRYTKTFRQGCPFEVYLKLSPDGQTLEVARLNEEHNHELMKEIFDHLPKQRNVCDADKIEMEEAIKLKANSKLLREKMERTTGKKVTLKDIANLKQKTKKDLKANDLDAVIAYLKKQKGSSVEVIIDSEDNFKGLLYMDSYMKNMYTKFPELLLVDATYKLLDLRMPVFLLLCVDGNGLSEIVCMFFLAEETKQVIEAAVNAFKKFCPVWENTRVVMSDKDFTERNTFTSCFPDAKLNICLYHTLRSFQREITCEKMGITSAERNRSLEILTKIAYSRTPSEYSKYHQELDSISRSVRVYIDTNWIPIKEQWVSCFKDCTLNLGETTNNRLESTFSKIKSVCSKYASILQFSHEFISVLNVLRSERTHDYVMSIVRKPIKSKCQPDLQKYSQLLTPYAFKYVEEQYHLSSKINPVLTNNAAHDTFTFRSSRSFNNSDNFTTTGSSCTCPFQKKMALPCKHILKARNLLGLSLFEPSLIKERWTMTYYRTLKETRWQLKSFDVHECDNIHAHQSTFYEATLSSNCDKRTTLTQAQKFRKGLQLGQQLASLLSEGGMATYVEREKIIKTIIERWKIGEKVELYCAPTEHSSISTKNIQETSEEERELETEIKSDKLTDYPEEIPPALKRNEIDFNIKHENIEVVDNDDDMNGKPDVKSDNISEKLRVIDEDTKINYKMPPRMMKRGRPKGAELTVIGLPKKKQKNNSQKLIPFCKLQPNDKDRIILECLTNALSAAEALSGKRLLMKSDLNYNIQEIPDTIRDKDNIDIYRTVKYFQKNAWLDVLACVHKKEQQEYCCTVCSKIISDESQKSIACDRCLTWFHFSCTSITAAPKKRNWFCNSCKMKYLK